MPTWCSNSEPSILPGQILSRAKRCQCGVWLWLAVIALRASCLLQFSHFISLVELRGVDSAVVAVSQGLLDTTAIGNLGFLLTEVKQKGKAQIEGVRQIIFCGNFQLLSQSKAQPIQK